MFRVLGHRTEFVNNEVNMIERLMHNLLEDYSSISKRKKFLYTAWFVAAEISELMRKKKRH